MRWKAFSRTKIGWSRIFLYSRFCFLFYITNTQLTISVSLFFKTVDLTNMQLSIAAHLTSKMHQRSGSQGGGSVSDREKKVIITIYLWGTMRKKFGDHCMNETKHIFTYLRISPRPQTMAALTALFNNTWMNRNIFFFLGCRLFWWPMFSSLLFVFLLTAANQISPRGTIKVCAELSCFPVTLIM